MKVSRARRIPGSDHYSASDSDGNRRLYRADGIYIGQVQPHGRQGWRLGNRYFASLHAAAVYIEALTGSCPGGHEFLTSRTDGVVCRWCGEKKEAL